MTDHYTIKLLDGKYTIISYGNGSADFLRHGEPWPAADDLKHVKVVRAMADRIQELEEAVYAVLEGTLDQQGRRHDDGICRGGADPTLVRQWEGQLRRVLEQE